MTCHEVKELSSDYLDQRLSPMKITLIEEHLKSCIDCSREIEALRHTVSFIGSLDEIETSTDFLARVRRKIESGNRKKRVWAWLFEPVRIKVPLEASALLLVGVIGFLLYRETPRLTGESSIKAPMHSIEVAQEKPKTKPDPSSSLEQLRGGSLASLPPVKVEGKISQPSLSEPSRKLREETVVMARRPEVFEIFVEDGALFERKVNILLERVSGKLLAQERSSGPEFLLTLEVPQSRRAEFLTALKQEEKSEAGAIGMGQLAANEKVRQGKAASAPESSLRRDEPMVRLHIRVLPKK